MSPSNTILPYDFTVSLARVLARQYGLEELCAESVGPVAVKEIAEQVRQLLYDRVTVADMAVFDSICAFAKKR